MNAPEVVRRYAVTLLDAAAESGVLEAVQRDVEGLVQSIDQSAELRAFLDDRLLAPQVRRRGLEELFAQRLQRLTLHFLLLMAGRRRTPLLPEVLRAFLVVLEERQGVIGAEVRSAVELSPEQLERLRERLAAYTGKQVRLDVRVDRSVRGGLVARVGDVVFDGSLSTSLERLRRHLVGA